jgi:peptide/nickel transport system permease protein
MALADSDTLAPAKASKGGRDASLATRSWWMPRRRTLLFYALTLVLLIVLNFWIPRAIPGDPLSAMADPSAHSYIADPHVRNLVASYYGLNESLPEQFWHYLTSLAHGDLGWSIQYNMPVTSMIGQRLPWTLLIVLASSLLAAVIALLCGVQAGWRRGRIFDHLVTSGMMLARTIPIYLVATLLLIWLSVNVGLFPLGGGSEPFTSMTPLERAGDIARHAALPVITLAFELVGGSYLLVRNSMVTVLGADFMTTTRAMGVRDGTRMRRYAMRNVLLPFFSLQALVIATSVSGVIFVETVFAYPGVGQMMFQAVQYRDYPLLQGGFLVFGVWVLVVNAAADVMLRFLDPRLAQRG